MQERVLYAHTVTVQVEMSYININTTQKWMDFAVSATAHNTTLNTVQTNTVLQCV